MIARPSWIVSLMSNGASLGINFVTIARINAMTSAARFHEPSPRAGTVN